MNSFNTIVIVFPYSSYRHCCLCNHDVLLAVNKQSWLDWRVSWNWWNNVKVNGLAACIYERLVAVANTGRVVIFFQQVV